MDGELLQLFDAGQAEVLLGEARSSSGLSLSLEDDGFGLSSVRGDGPGALSLSRHASASVAMADSPRVLMDCEALGGEETPSSSSTVDTAASSALSSSATAHVGASTPENHQHWQQPAGEASCAGQRSTWFTFSGMPAPDASAVRAEGGGAGGSDRGGSLSGSYNSSPRSEEDGSRDESVGGTGSGSGPSDARLADKKRRNRESARACRAKKKSSIMALQSEHEELRESYEAARKENESLRTINAALEKQLVFFQGLFRDTMQGGGAKPPLLPTTSPAEGEGGAPDPRNTTLVGAATSSGCALALSLLLATYNMQPTTGVYSPSVGDFVPHDAPFAPPVPSRRPGRALLSIDDLPDPDYPQHQALPPSPPPAPAAPRGGFPGAGGASLLLLVVLVAASALCLATFRGGRGKARHPWTGLGERFGGYKRAALRWMRGTSRAVMAFGGVLPS